MQKQEEEEKRNAAKAAAASKKGKKGTKKEEKKVEEVHEEEKKVEVKVEVKKELNLNLPVEFRQAVQEKVGNNFVFGPVTFKNLDNDQFDEEKAREAVLEALSKAPEIPKGLFIHGFKVLIKGRTLRRATTIQKHSRFLANLTVEPIFPPEPKPVEDVNEEEGGREEEEDE